MVLAVGLARFALLHVRGWAANSPLARARLAGDNDALRCHNQALRRELEIKDRRFSRLPPERRPHYLPPDRLAILALQAANGWNCTETARRFLVTRATISSWHRRLDEQGRDALIRTREPVNRYDELVTAIVHELKAALPSAGTRRLTDLLARAALHLSRSTVVRVLRREPVRKPQPPRPNESAQPTAWGEANPERSIVARRPGHVWSTDLTLAPITGGLFAPWLPWALPQCWPFGWWWLITVDHFSRAIVHVAVFPTHPIAAQICRALDEAVAIATGPPKYLVTDQGDQFGEAYRDWCESHGIRPRFGAIGMKGIIAVTERVILTAKSELLGTCMLPLRRSAMLHELALGAVWYNAHRPHRRFSGDTPDEIRMGRTPAIDLPRFETRPRYPSRHALCAQRGVKLELCIDYLQGRKHLPLVSLRRAA